MNPLAPTHSFGRSHTPSPLVSLWLFGIGSALVGLLDLIFREFEANHQPIQAWSDNIPHLPVFACITGALLVLAGLALLIRRTAALAAVVLAVIYFAFAMFSAPRLITAPRFLGHSPTLYVGLFVSITQQLILIIAAALLAHRFRGHTNANFTTAARILYGLCCLDFGVAHFYNIPAVSAMIPHWLPLSPAFWSVFTGIAFVLAGLALIANVLAPLAATVLGCMLLAFTLMVLIPLAAHHPHAHTAWGGATYNLTATASAWILAICLRTPGWPSHTEPSA